MGNQGAAVDLWSFTFVCSFNSVVAALAGVSEVTSRSKGGKQMIQEGSGSVVRVKSMTSGG